MALDTHSERQMPQRGRGPEECLLQKQGADQPLTEECGICNHPPHSPQQKYVKQNCLEKGQVIGHRIVDVPFKT